MVFQNQVLESNDASSLIGPVTTGQRQFTTRKYYFQTFVHPRPTFCPCDTWVRAIWQAIFELSLLLETIEKNVLKYSN